MKTQNLDQRIGLRIDDALRDNLRVIINLGLADDQTSAMRAATGLLALALRDNPALPLDYDVSCAHGAAFPLACSKANVDNIQAIIDATGLRNQAEAIRLAAAWVADVYGVKTS